MDAGASKEFAAEILRDELAKSAQQVAPPPVAPTQSVAPPPEPAPPPSEPAAVIAAPPPPLTSSMSVAPEPILAGNRYAHNIAAATDKLHKANAVTQQVETQEHAAERAATDQSLQVNREAARVAQENAVKQQELAKQNEADINEEIENHKKMYASNPTAWFANHDTQSRVGAVISMIGAGLAGKDPNKPLLDLIDRDVAEANRQDENLSKLGMLQQRRYQSGVGASRDRQAAMEARRIASISVVQDQLKAAVLQTADDKTKARLMSEDASLDAMKNEKLSAESHSRIGERIAAGQLAQGEQKLALEARGQDITLQAALAKANHSNQVKMVGVPDFVGDGIPSTTAGKQMDQVLASKDALYGLDEMQKIVEKIEKQGLTRLSLAQLTQAKQEMEGTLRRYVGTGANLSPEEKANVDALSADIKGLAVEKLTGFSLRDRVRATQRYIAHHYSNSVNALGTGNNVPKEGTNVYRVLHDEEIEQHKTKELQAKDQAEVDQVMTGNMSETAKALSVAAMAHQGNGVAKAMLDQAHQAHQTQQDERQKALQRDEQAAREMALRSGNFNAY